MIEFWIFTKGLLFPILLTKHIMSPQSPFPPYPLSQSYVNILISQDGQHMTGLKVRVVGTFRHRHLETAFHLDIDIEPKNKTENKRRFI